ncbi:MAG TPA: GNAT family N-acetyltransferase [Acidimicrobiales bacterium]
MDVLGREDVGRIAELCARAVVDAPSLEELEAALCTSDQPAFMFGDPAVGVVAAVACDDGAHVRLLAVDPAARLAGHGHALMTAVEDWARAEGHSRVITGADPPYFLWPGIPSTETGLLCLFERRHYSRAETNFNMRVDLTSLSPDPIGRYAMATAAERPELDEWMAVHWSNWRPEVLRALDKGNLAISRDKDGAVSAFCAFEVNRPGLLGPVAVRPELMGKGEGKDVLLGALHELRRRGRSNTDVVWIGPVVPYAAVGGAVSDVFFVYRKELG